MSDAQSPPPNTAVQFVLEARQAAAAAEASAAFCQHQAHVMDAALTDNTAAYMAAIRKCQEQTARAEHSALVIRACTVAIVALNVATLFLTLVQLFT